MKLVIIGDSHGHIANIKHVMGFAKNINVGGIIHVGDWDDVKSVECVLEYKIPLYSILGNADVDHEVENILFFNCKKFDPDFLKIEIDGRKIGVTHKIKDSDVRIANENIIFSGHYHSHDSRMIGMTKMVRPGALINGINFAVYETINNEVEFFNE